MRISLKIVKPAVWNLANKTFFFITERGSSSGQKQKPPDTDLSDSEDEAENAVESASDAESECEEIQSPVFVTVNPGM